MKFYVSQGRMLSLFTFARVAAAERTDSSIVLFLVSVRAQCVDKMRRLNPAASEYG